MAKSYVKYGVALLVLLGLSPLALAQIEVDEGSFFLDPEYSKTISMDFQDASLVDVLKIFPSKAG